MTNDELIKCLGWLKANYSEEFEDLDIDQDDDVEYCSVSFNIYTVHIDARVVYPIFYYNTPELGFDKSITDIDLTLSSTDYDDEDYDDSKDLKPKTFEQFVEMFNQLRRSKW